MSPDLRVRDLGRTDYADCYARMVEFTRQRGPETADEIWFVEHPPVFTQGQAGKAEHVLAAGDIPVVQSDRGGQVTYHGPGQQVVYFLLDLDRLGYGIRSLVTRLEDALIALLAGYGIEARSRREAPGVYVDDAKIASIGLRVRQARTYHGIALNVAMDLEPFRRINPCGYAGLRMTQIAEAVPGITLDAVRPALERQLRRTLGYAATD